MTKRTLKEAVGFALVAFPYDSTKDPFDPTKDLLLSPELVDDLTTVLEGTIRGWLCDLTDTNSSKTDPHTSTKCYGALAKKRRP